MNRNDIMVRFKGKDVIVWFKNMYNFALTLILRAEFDARYLSSSYLQDLLSKMQ